MLTIVEELSHREDVVWMRDAMELAGLPRNAWQYWYRIWASDEDIIDRMQLVDQRFENKIMHRAMKWQCHAGRAMLVLRNKYGYVEERHKINTKPPYGT